mmetsp:Transcript_12356/g.29593  ORF Transcript_12356/g.29593 Transcript_12356/m.29593 type:complete len:264 (+) Transcript_12356:242-1033(+)
MADPVIVAPTAQHSASVIWMHGLGDQGAGWASHAPELKMPWVKWIFPNAPNRAVTINMGAQMPAWADIKGLSPEAPEDEEGTMQTRDMVHKLIASEVASGIPASRIVVGGFSQGGAMAGFACLTHEAPLGGCFVLSGFLAMKAKVGTMLTAGGKRTPFFQAHGTQDPVVPFFFAQVSAQLVQSMVASMEFKQYPIQHTSSVEELTDLRAFLISKIPQAQAAPLPSNPEELSAKELKKALQERGVDTSDCLEKADLVNKVKSLL